MLKVWKYPVPMTDAFAIAMPAGAKPLSVQLQGDQVEMWVLVNPEAPTGAERFVVVGTGHEMPTDNAAALEFVGTFQLAGGVLIFHLFHVASGATL